MGMTSPILMTIREISEGHKAMIFHLNLLTRQAPCVARLAGFVTSIIAVCLFDCRTSWADPLLWAAGNSGQILHSTGNGAWTPQASGVTTAFYAIDFVDPAHGFAGGADDLRLTADGGQTWAAAPTFPPISGINAMDFVDPLVGFAGGNAGNAKTYKTTDGGMTWTSSYEGGFNNAFDVEFLDANRGWLAQGGGLRRTVNGGTNWASSSIAGINITEISFTNAMDGWVVSQQANTNDPSLAVTHDGGATFTTQLFRNQLQTPLAAVHFVDSMNGWAVGGNGFVLHTSDGGANWDDRSVDTTTDFEDVIFVDLLRGWCVAGTTIWGTSDGGLTWTTEYSLGSSGLHSITAIVPEPAGLVMMSFAAALLVGFSINRRTFLLRPATVRPISRHLARTHYPTVAPRIPLEPTG
jgi:photosystem II stability/assembly factor-like uncharacterized protein